MVTERVKQGRMGTMSCIRSRKGGTRGGAQRVLRYDCTKSQVFHIDQGKKLKHSLVRRKTTRGGASSNNLPPSYTLQEGNMKGGMARSERGKELRNGSLSKAELD